MAFILRGQRGLDFNGVFRDDPWYLLDKGKAVESGFGKITGTAKSYHIKKINEGLILPGLVNAHSHLELSFYKNKTMGGKGVHEFAKSLMNSSPQADLAVICESAQKEMELALSRGTFFWADIGNLPLFSHWLSSVGIFKGVRFLELLGFCSPYDKKRLDGAKEALGRDLALVPAAHSVYGSSPEIMAFVASVCKDKAMTSIHALEAESESLLFQETGDTVQFLKSIGQYRRHDELYGHDFAAYISGYFRDIKKVLLVHMNYAGREMLAKIKERLPQSAVVICERSAEFLGYDRKNWEQLLSCGLPLLLGTDSVATAPDLSIADEVVQLIEKDVMPQGEIWKAATSKAYSFFSLKKSDIPYFFFPEAKDEADLIKNSECVDLVTMSEQFLH